MCMVDVMLYLVDRGQFDEIMSMTVGEISSGMEESSLRRSRPEADPRFHRDFDVDLEGEVLELIDGSADLGGDEKLSHVTSDSSMELRLSRTDRSSYSESVVLDWMSRREEMGETMEPSEDPMILPTMESHRTLSESLFKIMESLRRSEMELMTGREFLEAGRWMLGSSTLYETWGSQD